MAKKKQSFEEALERLEEIVRNMEAGELTLDDTVNDAAQQVTILSTTLDGQLEEKPFVNIEQTEEE